MKFRGNKKGSGNGPKHLKIKGVNKPSERFKKVKKSKATANTTQNTALKRKAETVFKKRENCNSEDIKKNLKNRTKRQKGENSNERKRKADDESGEVKKKLKAKEEDEVHTRLDKKELKVARRKRKQNYELTVSLIKKYDGLRR